MENETLRSSSELAAHEQARLEYARCRPARLRELTSRERRAAAAAAGPRTKEQKRDAHELASYRNGLTRRMSARRGSEFRSILFNFTKGGVYHAYHATKGWRRLRLAFG